MLFSSITFLFVFLPIVLAVYFLVPYRFKNLVMLIASLFFLCMGRACLCHFDDSIHLSELCVRSGYCRKGR